MIRVPTFGKNENVIFKNSLLVTQISIELPYDPVTPFKAIQPEKNENMCPYK